MKGLEISVTNSDLIVKQEERLVKLFVIFKDKKYGTKYVIFTDNLNKELLYGSPLINGKKMVIMKFKDIKDEELIKQFVWNYLNEETKTGYEVIEIPEIDKLELIDNNKLDVKDEYIDKLTDIFFKKEEVVTDTKQEVPVKEKKSKGPILFLLLIILLIGGGVFYLKNNPELIYGKNIYVECKNNYLIEDINVSANETVILTFNNSQILKKHEREITYLFSDNDIYYEFKEKGLSNNYIKEDGEELFSDNTLEYKKDINYNLNKNYTLPKDYDELYDYYKNNGYICSNIER